MSLLLQHGPLQQQDAGVAWTPAALSLHAWWDADDASTFTFSSGSSVSEWRDKSGNAYHLSQAVADLQPTRSGTIGGNDAVVFDGGNDVLSSTSVTAPTAPVTMLLVARCTSGTSTQRTPFASRTGTSPSRDGRIYRPTGGTINLFQGSVLSSGVSWGTTDAHSIVGVFNGASSKIAVDSGSYTTGTAGTLVFHSGGWTLGALRGTTGDPSEYFVGEICEAIVATGEISSGDLAQWWSYCSTKWGTP